MSDIAIKVEGLSKRYRIGAQQLGYKTLKEKLTQTAATPFRALKSLAGRNGHNSSNRHKSKAEMIWALKDVSFEIKRGEVVGVIGRNGAGKSTLLKILSRITEPTEGYADITGRIASLLEVGTGFQPELTGRENIFLNGSILGMKRAEIIKRFDEIVAFAEVEKFIDTPVKHYSSGMYVRLAFGVAAHLDPEILLVDEVLAVGDVDFQKKCVGSMQSVADSGRTVLLVSHNVALIESLCHRVILLEEGQISSNGPTAEVISDYLSKFQLGASEDLTDHPRKGSKSTAWFSSIQILDNQGQSCREFRAGDELAIKLRVAVESPILQPWIGIRFRTPTDQLICHIANREAGYQLPAISSASEIQCQVSSLNLLPGRYIVDLVLADMLNRHYDQISGAAYFDVREADVWQSGMPMNQAYGLVFFPSQWKLVEMSKHDG
jgi:lipopolysaccharide transport system ATP-binding protein